MTMDFTTCEIDHNSLTFFSQHIFYVQEQQTAKKKYIYLIDVVKKLKSFIGSTGKERKARNRLLIPLQMSINQTINPFIVFNLDLYGCYSLIHPTLITNIFSHSLLTGKAR